MLNGRLLKNELVTEEKQTNKRGEREIKNIYSWMKMKRQLSKVNVIHIRGKFIALSAYIKKFRVAEINNVVICLNSLENTRISNVQNEQSKN